jgi:prepilin-type N-terminal cleavage/methylation domain-containing protein/prepilin-type processing-associated H-X9-DG protein
MPTCRPTRSARRALHPRSGFTLIELLVVMTIIAVLVGFAFSVFPRVRAKARATACQKNFKQVGGLMIAYAGDNYGKVPEAGQSKGWVTRLCEHAFPNEYPASDAADKEERYQQFFSSGSGQIFVCPANKYARENFTKSYLANGRVTGVRKDAEPGTGTTADYINTAFVPKSLTTVKEPGRTFLLIEQWDGREEAPSPPKNDTKLWNANDVRYAAVGQSDVEETLCECHGKGRHYLFVDGHIEYHEADPGLKDNDTYQVMYTGK